MDGLGVFNYRQISCPNRDSNPGPYEFYTVFAPYMLHMPTISGFVR
jgi:hypothetical protein